MTTQPDALLASDYVVCAALRKVADVFNVELLWERVRGGQDGVFLMDALKRHPRSPRARQRKETRYSHVVVRIPERDYIQDDRLEDGLGRRTLLQEFHRLHAQELGRYLADDAAIRYRLEPDPVLRPGEVHFLFGRAIHIPAEGERPQFRIQAAAVDGQSDWRDIGLIYPGQRLTLLNGDRRTSSYTVVGWPFPGSESILLILRPGNPAVVDVGVEPPGGLDLSEDGEGGHVVRDRRGRGLRVRVLDCPAEGVLTVMSPGHDRAMASSAASLASPITAERLPFETEIAQDMPPVVPEPEPPMDSLDETYPRIDHWGRREPMLGTGLDLDGLPLVGLDALSGQPPAPEQVTPQPTVPAPFPPSLPPNAGVPVEAELLPPTASAASAAPAPPAPRAEPLEQGTWVPSRPAAYLYVMGIALQRLSTYATAGISDWRLSFNRVGGVVHDGHPDAVAWLRVDNADRVFGEIVGSSEPLALPGMWRPVTELELELFAAPGAMAAHYLGWMRLPTSLRLPVPRERAVSFGRGAEADIAPRLLTDPRSLRWDGTRARSMGISAEYLGLSRRHLRLQVRSEDWWVQLESQNMPVYRLTMTGELVDVLNPGVNTVATAKPGELLVAGGYVLALGEVV